jgi:thiol-disulfide isomerase/thioredoxin
MMLVVSALLPDEFSRGLAARGFPINLTGAAVTQQYPTPASVGRRVPYLGCNRVVPMCSCSRLVLFVMSVGVMCVGGLASVGRGRDAGLPATRPSVLSAVITLSDADGGKVQPLSPQPAGAGIVLLFIRHECPIANSYAPEMNRIVKQYGGEGKEKFRFFFVHVDQELSAKDAATHAKEFGYTAPVLLDTQRQLVKRVVAKVTPEADRV